ncbi:unnamed protein product [Danaus chrysippus]|uniref:(African queen) hypothetical protein n=1 Tax=Danaus chrysippus TaxID=151541 RepID=A0A8J2W9B3_9NEOP|nr:unnamed protein product [Danaus chrysippus]
MPKEYTHISDIVYSITSLGSPMIIIQGFKFYKHHESHGGNKVRWTCGCLRRKKSVFNRSSSGTPILNFNGYRFGFHIKRGLKTRWRCGSARHKKCKAHIYTVDDVIVKYQTEHNHNPPKTYSNF